MKTCLHIFKWFAEKCESLASLFEVDANTAFWTGFLHDIGKCLAKKNIKKRRNFIGHAQVGSCIVSHILTKFNSSLGSKKM